MSRTNPGRSCGQTRLAPAPRLRRSHPHFRAREATELSAAQRAFTARALRMKSEAEVRDPSLVPLPAPGAPHQAGFNSLRKTHPAPVRVGEGCPTTAIQGRILGPKKGILAGVCATRAGLSCYSTGRELGAPFPCFGFGWLRQFVRGFSPRSERTPCL